MTFSALWQAARRTRRHRRRLCWACCLLLSAVAHAALLGLPSSFLDADQAPREPLDYFQVQLIRPTPLAGNADDSSQPDSQPSPEPEPTVPPEDQRPSPVPEYTVLAMATALPSPTATHPDPSPTATATATPVSSPTDSPTPSVTTTVPPSQTPSATRPARSPTVTPVATRLPATSTVTSVPTVATRVPTPMPVLAEQVHEAIEPGPRQQLAASPEQLRRQRLTYWQQVRARIARQLWYPSSARRRGVGARVVVRITVDDKGRLLEAEQVSGNPGLSAAALQAVRAAQPFPEPTGDILARGRLTAQLPIRFYIK